MISLILAAAAFIGIHLGVSGTRLRDRLTAAIGLNGYMIGFSVASIASIVWLIAAYNAAPYTETWGQLLWWKPFQLVLMLPAFVLVVAGLATPNPTSVAQEGRVSQPVRGLLRITRHPFLMGVTLWAAVHVIGNGDLASLLFFGSLGIVSAAGPASIDAKRRRALGPAWDGFARQTSIVPFAAIAAGRNRLVLPELGWWRPLAGVVAYAIILGGHVHLFGISPFPDNW